MTGLNWILLKKLKEKREDFNTSIITITAEDILKADRSKVFKHYKNHRLTSDTPKLEGRYELDIFVNGNIIEIFANGGRYVLSNIVYDLRHQLSGKIDKIMVAAELL